MVVDDQTNAVLFKKNPDEVRSLASITKLMSTLVLSELPLSMDSSTVITEDDYDPFSHHIEVGQTYTLDELWKIALVGSSNSAIRTLVRASGFNEADFALKMNEKAKALGLNTLRFVEPTGLDSRNMGTAPDVLRLLKFALKEDKISDALHLPEYYVTKAKKKQHVWSTNWLLTNWVPNKFDKDVLVGKTGYIDLSGYNFVARIPGPKNHVLRVVVLGAATNEARFSEARDLAEWVFENYSWPDDENYNTLISSEAR
jgi:D-alanyl-D-alanine endopeptidase (penicillin-binding protein 7)